MGWGQAGFLGRSPNASTAICLRITQLGRLCRPISTLSAGRTFTHLPLFSVTTLWVGPIALFLSCEGRWQAERLTKRYPGIRAWMAPTTGNILWTCALDVVLTSRDHNKAMMDRKSVSSPLKSGKGRHVIRNVDFTRIGHGKTPEAWVKPIHYVGQAQRSRLACYRPFTNLFL